MKRIISFLPAVLIVITRWIKTFCINSFVIFFLLISFQSKAQNNNLAAGDIAFVSYHADVVGAVNDQFSIVVLRTGGIPASTVIYFTDNGWSVVLNDWIPSNEGYLKWTAPAAAVAQGKEIFFSSDAADNWTASTGTLSLVSGANIFALANGGDQVIAYQTGPTGGPAGTYLNTTRRFIGGIHCNIISNITTNAGWDVGTTSGGQQSAIPTGLTGGAVSGNTAFVMTKTILPFGGTVTGVEQPDNGKYNCAGSTGSVPATTRDAIYLFGTGANWDLSDVAFPSGQSSNNCTYLGPPAITIHPSASAECVGLPVSFTVAAGGSGLSYQWEESVNAAFTVPIALTNTGIYSNTTTVTLNISDNTSVNGRYYRCVVSNADGSVNTNPALLTATTPILPTGNALVVHPINASNNLWYNASCALLARVVPTGINPVNGNVAVETWRESSIITYGGWPYVQRHHQVMPATGASTATAKITLYFSQIDFDNFNDNPGSILNLPTGPADVAGKANLRISKFNGSTNNGTGLPSSYTNGRGALINPPDENIVWNATYSRWEVTTNVSGFSGFFVQTYSFLLNHQMGLLDPTTTQPTCAQAGTIVVNHTASTLNMSYSINGGTTWSASPIFSGLGPGNYNISIIIHYPLESYILDYGNNPVVIDAAPALPAILPPGHATETHAIGTNNDYSYTPECYIISRVVPSGDSPVSGNVASEVWRESSVLTYGGQPYVQRHYQITPTAGSTATVTLYFSQTEFDNFNAAPGSVFNLPVNATDAAGKANLRISKFNGSSGNGTGLPGTYSSGGSLIDPQDENIFFNEIFNRWEVTFTVSGFSGFFVQTYAYVLPVRLISFAAQKTNNDIRLKWQTAAEINNDHFELERSLDGRTFTSVTQVAASYGTSVKNYEWNDAGAALLNSSKIFYRLKIISTTGSAEYSNTIVVRLDKTGIFITGVNPNPFRDKIYLNMDMPKTGQLNIKLIDMAGRILQKEYVQAPKGSSTYSIKRMEKLSKGIYFISAEFEGRVLTYKVQKK